MDGIQEIKHHGASDSGRRGPSPSTEAVSKRNQLRQLSINPNHWYAVARSDEVGQRPHGVVLWQQPVVLYRDSQGQVQALADRCPHRQVRLSQGQVNGDRLVCAYHGWQFDAAGACVHIPYLGEKQRLPNCGVRPYPVREQDGFIWIFPGNTDAMASRGVAPLPLPEWDHLNYIVTVSVIDVNAHYSFLIENLMDMYHGHLHDDYQAWKDPILKHLQATSERVDAHYQAQSYYRIDKIWSVSQLFIPALRQLHPEPLDVSYVYPNWVATLGQDFKICCLFCPVDLAHTRAYLLHFTSLHAFHRLHKLPVTFRRWLKTRLFGAAQPLLDGLVAQDVVMLEQEQQAFWADPQAQGPELNSALAAVQRLMRQQAETVV
ncbi:Rieske domain/chlorophyllide a oxygenase domain protein [Halomicronema hongdechloris C2206]|uniref:Rieske domain/chlorophyllide a oxygenase domain protein n=2 Tax=Halomicronema hongdechloris TaxID=1209493 RepID=A0A1Z3HKR2_9CYAN|nr:Rieske domain/chlorophyllide a oxygenase domain protein [Halomicronema hongdechloris C2206]